MKNKITHNWGLKLGSLVFSFFLWIIVTNMNDPDVQYKIYDIQVKVLNDSVITEQNETYEILNGTDRVEYVTVVAPRSIVDSLRADDIIATADFNNITENETVPIRFDFNKYSSSIVSYKASNSEMDLKIENRREKTLALSVIPKDMEDVSDGYMVGTIKPSSNQIRISGPESLINQVSKAQIEVYVAGFTQDIATDADVILLDSAGEVIKSDAISLNMTTVNVNIEILQTKEIGLKFASMGTPADGYVATGTITSDPDSIRVAGKASALKGLDSISISADELNITGQTSDMTALVNVSKYLPSGVVLADSSFSGNVSVKVYIEKTIDKRLELDTDLISWENVPEGYSVELSDATEDKYAVTINGQRTIINDTSADDIIAIANLKDIFEQEDTVGSLYHVTLDFINSKGDITVKTPVEIWFSLVAEE